MALRDYLASRRAEIEEQIKALRDELSEIRVAEAAITGTTPIARPQSPKETVPTFRDGSIKDWILKALEAGPPHGLETEDVITWVELLGGPNVPRSSMTPQLSRLKSSGFILLDGRNWRLVSASDQKDEAPGVQPPSAPMPEWDLDDEIPF
jgi:hypothetical protein